MTRNEMNAKGNFDFANPRCQPRRDHQRAVLLKPHRLKTQPEILFTGQQSMKTGYLYRKKGNPEPAMTEIRRTLWKKISGRIERERLSSASVKESSTER